MDLRLRMNVNCYYLRKYAHKSVSVCHEQMEVYLQNDGTLPKLHAVRYCLSLDDRLNDKFDPRANWDMWAQGNDLMSFEELLEYTPVLGLTYLCGTLRANMKKLFPEFDVVKHNPADWCVEEFLKHSDAVFDLAVKENQFNPIEVPKKKKKTKREDDFIWTT